MLSEVECDTLLRFVAGWDGQFAILTQKTSDTKALLVFNAASLKPHEVCSVVQSVRDRVWFEAHELHYEYFDLRGNQKTYVHVFT